MVETSRGESDSLSPRRPQALEMWQATYDFCATLGIDLKMPTNTKANLFIHI